MPGPLVHTQGLSRVFGARVAVDGLTIEVGAGEILSLLGPNGAGKTTTFRMLAGLLMPSSGTAVVAGVAIDPASAGTVRSRVGLLTEAPGLWERLSVRFNLLTYARLHGVGEPDGRVTALLDLVGLSDRAADRAGALSKGLKQRVAVARTLLHNPPVVLFDEPTSGLDPASARQVRDLIRRLRDEGRAVLVSTHNLAEAETLSDRIAVMNTRLLACDTPRRLRERRHGGLVRIEIDGGALPWTEAASAAGGLVVQADGDALLVRLDSARRVPDLVAALAGAGARLRRVDPQDPSLEDAYLALVHDDA